MIEMLYYGSSKDSQRVILTVDQLVDADVGYREVPPSRRDDDRRAWGVVIHSDNSVDEDKITDALASEFGSVSKA